MGAAYKRILCVLGLATDAAFVKKTSKMAKSFKSELYLLQVMNRESKAVQLFMRSHLMSKYVNPKKEDKKQLKIASRKLHKMIKGKHNVTDVKVSMGARRKNIERAIKLGSPDLLLIDSDVYHDLSDKQFQSIRYPAESNDCDLIVLFNS